jgi:hypothetical protein
MGNFSPGDFYAVWDSRFEEEFRQLLQSFKSMGFGSHQKVRFTYYPHAWSWSEWSLKFVPEMVQENWQPEDFIYWWERTVQDYIDAFEGQAGKLVYSGIGGEEWVEWTGDDASYNDWQAKINSPDGGNVLSQYSLQAGSGARNGMTEALDWDLSNTTDWGSPAVNIGDGWYQVIDDSHFLISDPARIFATENECYAQCGWPAGTDDYWHVKMSQLKMLQLRMNWVFLSSGAYNTAPLLNDYAFKVMGKHYYDSPDAWVVLREAQDGTDNSGRWMRNWERWLFQREIDPDGHTVRTYPHTSPQNMIGTTYEARRTDHINGSDYIYFDVHNLFMKGNAGDIQIKVTYLDNFSGDWWIEYDATDGNAYKASEVQTNQNDGMWKTITFSLDDTDFNNSQEGEMDFRIYNGGENDITVRFVRIIKMTDPATIVRHTDKTGSYYDPDVSIKLSRTGNILCAFTPPASGAVTVTIKKLNGARIWSHTMQVSEGKTQFLSFPASRVMGKQPYNIYIINMDGGGIYFTDLLPVVEGN